MDAMETFVTTPRFEMCFWWCVARRRFVDSSSSSSTLLFPPNSGSERDASVAVPLMVDTVVSRRLFRAGFFRLAFQNDESKFQFQFAFFQSKIERAISRRHFFSPLNKQALENIPSFSFPKSTTLMTRRKRRKRRS